MGTISFVYFNIGLNVVASILFILFFVYAYNERYKIYRRHDTISSFCAEKNRYKIYIALCNINTRTITIPYTNTYKVGDQDSYYHSVVL